MATAPAKNAPSVPLKRHGFALTRQAVLKTAPIGAEPTVQPVPALCVTSKHFPIALPRNPARKRAAIGAFQPPQTTAGARIPALCATRIPRGTVTLNRSASGQTRNGAQAAAVQAPKTLLITPVPPIVPILARPVQPKPLGIAATRTRASQTAATGAGITAPLLRARFVLPTRSGTVTRSRPAKRQAAIGATRTAPQAHARFAQAKTRGVVTARNPAQKQEPSGAEPIVLQTALRAAMIPRGIAPRKKPALASAPIGAPLIVPPRRAPSAQAKTPGHARTKKPAVV